jgi:hypothetical protein
MHAFRRGTLGSLVIAATSVMLALAAKPLSPDDLEGPPEFRERIVDLFPHELPARPTPPWGNKFEARPPERNNDVFAWSKLITAENLEDEIKALQKQAEEATKTLNNFRGNGRVLAQNTFAELAVLFGVIAQYDGDVRWRKEAASLTKVFAQAEFDCRQPGVAAFADAQLSARQLADLIRGVPLDLPPAAPLRNWAEVTSRPAMMRRIEEARTGPNVPRWLAGMNEFKKNKDALLREVEVMRVIAEVIKDRNFENGDDDAYQKYGKAFAEQCAALVGAIKDGNPENAQSAMSRVSRSCDACHGDFR